MKYFSIVLIALLFVSCGTSVGVDYDKEVNFAQYTTYNFFPTIDSGLNDLDDKRIMNVTDSLLQARGFKKSETPQVYINFYAKERLTNSRNTIGIGIGGGGGNVGVGVGGGIPIGGRVVEQVITMDFIDVSNDDLVWQAIAETELKEKAKPLQKKKHYEEVVSKILKKYPPSK
ncbi:DUF4136 domain-containing protein [Marixanthomonas sp. SCSIO 43207]|uniref:DUF4136 domain-containing protein n=1 Tax=Marixanthomonas sp. SCSIO 43207 TaxID=2779360 RepID=UPI001CA9EB37|nr:DUF4136 domain-containing protein [Marixanthomonas sp. SCSIO 43207]UAB79900.1 DUF4136 domain-containing protein [Marixanthomonas sp. SCSIO 43207]